MPENGVDLARFTPKPSRTDSQFNILFVGRLVPVKQPALILHALAQAQLPPNAATVVYVGDGPEADRIRRDTAELNLSANVDLIGSVPHEMLIRYYHGASILALPSIHESGGAVLLEAMACGVPCVTVDYGGPSTYITTNTGIKIPLCSYDKLVTTFAQAFRYLYNNPETLKHYGIAARHVVEAKFSWTRKAATMVEYYEDVLNSPPSPTNARCRHPRT